MAVGVDTVANMNTGVTEQKIRDAVFGSLSRKRKEALQTVAA